MKIVVVSRDGEEKLRVPAEMVGGILRNGKNILINSDLISASSMTKKEVLARVKRGDITPEIEALGMYIGDNGNGLVCRWLDDNRSEADVKRREQLYDRKLNCTKDRIVIICDARDDLGDTVELDGCRWTITGRGRTFDRGAHRVCYAYVEFAEITDPELAYTGLRKLLRNEQERWQQQLKSMMANERNDGVNPPYPVCPLLQPIIDMIGIESQAAVKFRRRVETQAKADPSTTGGFLRRQAGERALKLLNADRPHAEVLRELEAYTSDPQFIEYVRGM